MLGSPLGMFLSIRQSKFGHKPAGFHRHFRGLDVLWPAQKAGVGWRLFNVFHPDDPIAYRVEPLLNPEYVDVSPKKVPHMGGLRMHHQVSEWWGSLRSFSLSSAPSAVPEKSRTRDSEMLLVPLDVEDGPPQRPAPALPREHAAERD